MPTAKERRLRLRGLMRRPGLTVAPSAFNAWSASLIEAVGFDAVHVSGSSTNRAHGYSDLSLLGMAEMVAIHERIVEATKVPVIGDAEAAFGGPVHTARTVRAYERAGLAAIHIEDEQVPKSPGSHAVVPGAEMIAKLKVALDSRTDPDFIIIARSNARGSESLKQVIDRVLAYAETGVDAIWPGVRRPEELSELAPLVKLLPMVGIPPRELMTIEAYAGYGFKIGCLPGALGQAATAAMAEILETFKRTGTDDEYWARRPEANRWRQWFNNLGKEQVEAVSRVIGTSIEKS